MFVVRQKQMKVDSRYMSPRSIFEIVLYCHQEVAVTPNIIAQYCA